MSECSRFDFFLLSPSALFYIPLYGWQISTSGRLSIININEHKSFHPSGMFGLRTEATMPPRWGSFGTSQRARMTSLLTGEYVFYTYRLQFNSYWGWIRGKDPFGFWWENIFRNVEPPLFFYFCFLKTVDVGVVADNTRKWFPKTVKFSRRSQYR